MSSIGAVAFGEDDVHDYDDARASPFSEWSIDFSVRNTLDQARGPEYAWAEFGVPPGVLGDRSAITLIDRTTGQEVRVGLLPGDIEEHDDGSIHRAKVHFKGFWDAGEARDYTIVFGRTPSATGPTISSSVQGDFVVINDGPRQYQVHTADSLFKSPQSLYYLYLLNGEFRAYGTVLTRVGGNQLDPDQASFGMWWGDRTYLDIERSGLVNRVTLRYDRPEIYHWGPGGSSIQEVIRYPDLISAEVQLTFYQGVPRVDVHSRKTIHERFWNHNGFVMEFTAIRGDGADWQGEFETVYGTDARIVMTTTTQGPTWTRQSTQWQGIDVASDAAPAYHDLDGDGDLDMVLGSEDQGLKVFQNVGDRAGAVMEENATWTAGLPNLTSAAPTLGDLDGDGDAELLVGEAGGTLRLYRNDGSANGPPVWTRWSGNFDRLGLGPHTAPNLGDADGDGDLDIVVGLADGTLKGIINTGSPTAHSWSMDDRWVDHLSHGLTRAPCDGYSVPFMVDVDSDGDTDLLLGSDDGKVIIFENVAQGGGPQWTCLDVSHHAGVLTGSHWESNSTPTMVDIDGDGDADLLIGNHQGRVYHYSFDGNTTPAKGHNNLQPLRNGSYRHIRDKDGNDGPFAVEGYGDEWYGYYVLANPRNGYAALRYLPDFDRLAYKQEYWGDEFEFAGGNVSYYPYEPVAKEYVTRAQITSNPMGDGVSAGTFISQTGTSAGFVMQPMTAMTYESDEILLLDLQRRTEIADYDAYAAPLGEPLRLIQPVDLVIDEISLDPPAPGNGEPANIYFRVRNVGNETAENVSISIDVTVGEGATAETTVIFNETDDIPPGSPSNALWRVDNWGWQGRVEIAISVDEAGVVDETDEDNNNASYVYWAEVHSLPWSKPIAVDRSLDTSHDADAIICRDGKLYVVWETARGEEEIDIDGRAFDPTTGTWDDVETLVTDSHYAVEPNLGMKGDDVYLAYSSNIEALRNYHETAHAKYYWGEKFDLYAMVCELGTWAQPQQVTRAIDYDDSHQAPELVLQAGLMEVYFRSTHFQFYTGGNQMNNVPFQEMDLRTAWEFSGGGWSSGNRTVGETGGSQGWWGGPSASPHGNDEVWVIYESEVGNAQWDLFAEWSKEGSPSPGHVRLTNTGGVNEIRPTVVSGGWPPTMLMAYETDRNGNRDIAVRMKMDDQAWGPERLLTTDPASDMKPTMAYDGRGNYWIAWESFRTGNKDIFISRFDGTNWHGPYQVTTDTGSDEDPVIVCDDQNGHVYIVWETDRNGMGNKDIYMRHMLPLRPVLTLKGPSEAFEDAPAVINATVVDANDDLHRIEWDWGDGEHTISRDDEVGHVYEVRGSYQVSAIAYDRFGRVSTEQRVAITVENVPPVANISGPSEVGEDEAAQYSATGSYDTPSDKASLMVEWDFGDGSTSDPMNLSEGANVTHRFKSSGEYTVKATVTDDDGETGSAELMVSVTNRVPSVEAWARFEDLVEDELGGFSGLAHDTPSDEDQGFTYIWDWGDGTGSEPQLGPLALHSYNWSGTYNATLRVIDDDGAEGRAVVQVLVGNAQPTVSVTGKGSVEEDEGITLTAVGDDTPHDLEHLEFQWDWGDGTVSDWDNQAEATHIYSDDGSYLVTVTVRDDDGVTGIFWHSVMVDNKAPKARASAMVSVAKEGETVHFTAEGTTDTPSDMEDLTYRWDMGTGFVEGAEVDHVFKAAGIYTITLTVTDDNGDKSRAMVDVLVTNTPPVAAGWVGPMEVRVGQLVFLDGSNSTDDPWDMGGLKYRWTMGDGGVVHTAEGAYAFALPGTYRVALEVTDGDGDARQWVVTVNVQPAKEDDGNGDGGGTPWSYIIAGAVALVIVIIMVLVLAGIRAREGDGTEGDGTEDDVEGEMAAITPQEEGAEIEGPPEPEGEPGREPVLEPEPEPPLVEVEVEVLRPREDVSGPEDLIQRIEEDLDLEEE